MNFAFLLKLNNAIFVQIHVATRRSISTFFNRLCGQWEQPPSGAEQKLNLGTALQQADALNKN
jgi:hypothetical protein